MAKFMDLYTELPATELAAKVERGIGSFTFSIGEPTARGPRFFWEHGNVSIDTLNLEQIEIAREDTHLRSPRSKLNFYPSPDYEGSLDVYQMAAIAINEWTGDLALLNWGETIDVERINGKTTLNHTALTSEELAVINRYLNFKVD